MLSFIIVLVISFIVGVFGFAQIIGSIQNIRYSSKFTFTLILWIAILVGGIVLVRNIAPDDIWAVIIAYGVSFVIMLCQGKIE